MKTIIPPLCNRCNLHKTRKQIVFGRGNPKSDLLIIGEAPGKNEDEQGIPFCGQSGIVLDEWFKYLNLKESDYYLTNIIHCRPLDNRDPLEDEIKACKIYLAQFLVKYNPSFIITLGKVSSSRFRVGFERGRPFAWMQKHLVFPLFHPAALLYNSGLKEIAYKHLSELKKTMESTKQQVQEVKMAVSDKPINIF